MNLEIIEKVHASLGFILMGLGFVWMFKNIIEGYVLVFGGWSIIVVAYLIYTSDWYFGYKYPAYKTLKRYRKDEEAKYL